VFSQANLHAFNYFELKFLMGACWHNTCSSLGNFKKIGFPGWPDPNLDSVSGFGVSIQKGGLHQPPFSISGTFHYSLVFPVAPGRVS
jgi:hypothetical protein